MLRVNRKIALTLSLLILMIVALLFAYIQTWSTSASESENSPIYLHGPSLDPIHLNSNKTLTPIHMHSHEIWQFEPGSPIYTPITTSWEEIYPAEYDPFGGTEYHLSSWNDTGDPPGMLSPNDQIDMTDLEGNVTWYHVDRMTVTLLLSGPYEGPYHEPAPPTMAIELKWQGYWPEIKYPENLPPNLNSTWHEVWPNYSNVYNLTSWIDDPLNKDGRLSFTDSVDLTDVNGTVTWWHVESAGTDLILREKIMDPICTWWHEIYPSYSNWHHITSWESYPDPYCDRLSPKDQIDMVNETTGITYWYFVDRVTVTLNVTLESDPDQWMKIELKTNFFEEMYEVFKHPYGTLWHEVYPIYSPVYNLTQWDFWLDDNCNGVLDVCDYIWLLNMSSPFLEVERYHVEDITYDLILNKKITDPVCTDWHELYPVFDRWYHAINHLDEDGDGFLSPGDQITLLNQSDVTAADYHVDNVTLTLHVYSDIWGDFYLELNATFEEMYLAKINPVGTWWINIYPYFGEWYNLTDWQDNCNGVLGYCDNITLSDPLIPWSDTFHVEELSIDIVVTKTAGPSVHDVAVTNVTTSKTGCLPMPTVGQGYNATVNATVENQGNFTETFDVTVYANTTLIGTQTNIILPSGGNTTLTFTWDTTSYAYGNYTIIANAAIVPGETDLADNILARMPEMVTIVGDVDGDRDVDVGDQRKVQLAMFSSPGHLNWNPNMDIDCDLDVDVGDQRKQQLHMFESW